MKTLLLFTILLAFAQISIAQIKVDDYSTDTSDSERGRIYDFLKEIQKEPESKGLIVIHSGRDKEKLAIILRHIEGIKLFINERVEKALSERIYFKIDDDEKNFLDKELWIYPKDIALPEIETRTLNLDNLTTKYLYTTACVGCEPPYPLLSPDYEGFELYVELLKKYPDYRSEINIHPASFDKSERKMAYEVALDYAAECRKLLTETYGINKNRISITVDKTIGKDDVTKAKIFIVPKTVR